MYIPGYVGGVGGVGAVTGTTNTNLALPQYLAFNSLQHQYSLLGPSSLAGANYTTSSYVTTPTAQHQQQQQQQQQQQPAVNTTEDTEKQTLDTAGIQQSQNCKSNLTTSISTSSMIEEVSAQYLKELQAEKEELEKNYSDNAHAIKLLQNEITRHDSAGLESLESDAGGLREPIKYFDIYRERPVRLTVRALVPTKEHPKFNFVGKLLGPKGNSMKRLQEETMTKMAVLGRGSMRDKQKEEELRASQDPKYQHLQEDLHVEITAFAPPAEAHARIAFALTEVRKYLIPDSNDEIRQEQMRELEIMTASGDPVSQATLLLNPSLAGLATLQGLPTGTVNNAFVSSSFQPSNNIVLPTGLDTTESPVTTTKEGILKSPSSCSSAKIRQATAPYTKHV